MRLIHALLATTLVGLSPALAADPESCATIRLSDPADEVLLIGVTLPAQG